MADPPPVVPGGLVVANTHDPMWHLSLDFAEIEYFTSNHGCSGSSQNLGALLARDAISSRHAFDGR